MDNDVIPMTIAFLRERLGDEAEPAVALIQARNDFGTEKYGKPLRTFDGRKTLWDRAEEIADDLNYTLKFLHEWDEVADMAQRAGDFISSIDTFLIEARVPVTSREAKRLAAELRETAARMRKDVARIQPKPAEPPYGQPGHFGGNYQCHGCGEFTATYTNGHRDICDKCWVTTAGALHYTKFVADEAKQ